MSQIKLEQIRMYLLGRLDQAKRAEIEESLLTDEAFYEELLIAEDELTDQYLAKELSDDDLRSFETHFLSAPERRHKLRFARSLQLYVRQSSRASVQEDNDYSVAPARNTAESRSIKRPFFSFLPIQNPVFAYSFAAVVLLVVIGVFWVAFKNLGTTTGQENVLLVTLTPGLTRETGEIKSIQIPPDTGFVQLQLRLTSDDYQSYHAELVTSERGSIFLKQDLKPESANGNKVINVTIPAGLLKRDDYRVKLGGRRPDGSYEDVGSYVFRVVE